MKNRPTYFLATLLILKFLLQYFLEHEIYELHRDEFLYLDQGNHLAWGYFSVPPFTSWLSWCIHLLGGNEWLVRFFPALFGALTLLVVWKTIALLRGDLYALVLGGVCVLFSPLLRLNGLFQPNSFDVLVWTSAYYFLFRYLYDFRVRWLLLAGAVVGCGFLNKYNVAFLLMGLVPALLFSRQRNLLLHRDFRWASGVALLLVLPNGLWQYQHDFPVLKHLKLLREHHLVHVDRLSFLVDQLLYCLPALPVFIAAAYALYAYPRFRPYRFMLGNLLFTLAAFVFFRAKSYYALGLYPIYLSFGAVYISRTMNKDWKMLVRPFIPALPVLLLVMVIPMDFPVKTPAEFVAFAEKDPELGMHRWEDGKKYPIPQDFADMVGWKELAAKTAAAVASLPADEPVLILCDNYGQAGAINYYTRGSLRAQSFHDDYLGWLDVTTPYRHLVRIKNAGNRESELAETLPLFESGGLVDSIANPYAREYKTDIFVFRKAKVSINERVRAERDELRKYGV